MYEQWVGEERSVHKNDTQTEKVNGQNAEAESILATLAATAAARRKGRRRGKEAGQNAQI